MADGQFSGLFRQFFQVGINIKPAVHGVVEIGEGWVGWEEMGGWWGGSEDT